MVPYKIISVIKTKKLYKLKIEVASGEEKEQWLDEAAINLIHPAFFSPRSDVGQIESSNDENALDQNLAENSVENLTCKDCHKQFKRRDHLNEHIKNKHSSKKDKFICPECSSNFGYKSNWTQHMKRAHGWAPEKAKANVDGAKITMEATEIVVSEDEETIASRLSKRKRHPKRKCERKDDGETSTKRHRLEGNRLVIKIKIIRRSITLLTVRPGFLHT